MRIAILFTCFNRKVYTLRCLKKLTELISHDNDNVYQIFVCDDNSTDGTRELIIKEFPEVELLRTKGNYFWCKGMYVVMKTAFEQNYDIYLMINDDVDFYDNMLMVMLNSYKRTATLCGIVGTTKSSKNAQATYGGRYGEGNLQIIIPNNTLPECELANWNCFLIPNEVICKVGLIDNKYAHGYGDFDYSMMMHRKGIPIFVAYDYVGECERNSGAGTFRDASLSRRMRIKRLFSKKGRPLYSSMHYALKNYGFLSALFELIKYGEYIKDILLCKNT